ncbi:uncharacterized protein LOC125950289 [Anopheles darlingi]|uniref:uncharacterized protein LOC125950289 n=1 Tax=Anopheles darlingi TaxID=43151 RepID=UPI00210067CC|nr:uncharacterized protein LOC125950289 [Anopheles darlingi]XP_049534108.1 uncharacterized protein LOC125950289 [Anopheles darlingi]
MSATQRNNIAQEEVKPDRDRAEDDALIDGAMKPRHEPDQLRHCFVPADRSGCLGLHLSRTPWDPYPWVSGVVEGSCAALAGVRVGDCVLEANGEDLLGLKVMDIARRVRDQRTSRLATAGVGLLLWNSGFEKNNLNPQSLSRFANCLQGIAGLLECPVCLEIVRPPAWQCNHGHLLCSTCRAKTHKCPICREVLCRVRCIVADKLFHYLVQTLGYSAEQREQGRSGELQPQQSRDVPPAVGRRLPLSERSQHQRSHRQKLQQHQQHHEQHQPESRQTHKHGIKLKANNGPNGASSPAIEQRTSLSPSTGLAPRRGHHCPSGQQCERLKTQQDLLLHLQKVHQLSVVQYYVTVGDTVDVSLPAPGHSSLVCVTLLIPPKSTIDRQNASTTTTTSQMFFVSRHRCREEPTESLYWLWHVESDDEPTTGSNRWKVQLVSTVDGELWHGQPVSLGHSYQEVLRSKQCARFKSDDARTLRVRLMEA